MTLIACCFSSEHDDEPATYNEKSSLMAAERVPRTEEEVAADIVDIILKAEKPGENLKNALDDTVRGCSWTSRLAEAILERLKAVIDAGAQMAQVMKEAVDKATKEAMKDVYNFVKEHPVYTTVIALGVLVLLMPWVLEALGFGELGPIENTFAAWWQSRYAGYVPKKSLWSFFQRLGMVWRRYLSVSNMEYRCTV